MRRLGATGPHVDPLEELSDLPTRDDRPAVRVVMIQSIDGTVAVDGRSGPLSGPADTEIYLANRSLADVVLVGAETVRAEDYGPARLTPALVAAREGRGQPPRPRIGVVSRSLDLDPASRLFTGTGVRPTVLTTEDASRDRRDRLAEVADVVVAGRGDVDLTEALHELGRQGTRRVVCEGGPTLNGALFRAGLVDEVCLTIAPVLAGDGPRAAAGRFTPPVAMRLVASYEHGGFVVLMLRTG